MGLFITACAVHTPSSNPKRPAARKISLMSHHNRSKHSVCILPVPVLLASANFLNVHIVGILHVENLVISVIIMW